MFRRSLRLNTLSILILLILLLLVLSLNAVAQSSNEKKQLLIWDVSVAGREDLFNAVAEEFEKTHPDINVKVELYKNDPYKTKLQIVMNAGNPPHIFENMGGGILRDYVDSGLVAKITKPLSQKDWIGPTKMKWKEAFKPASLGLSIFNSEEYGIPENIRAVGIYYNQDIFKKYNIQIPKTFEELKEVIKRLREKGLTPIALGNRNKWTGAFYISYLANRIGGQEIFIKAAQGDPKIGFDHPSFIKASEMIRDLVEIQAFPKGFNGLNFDDSRGLFINEIAAMQLTGSFLEPIISGEAPEFLNKLLGWFPFPAVKDGKGNSSNILGGVSYLSISSKAIKDGVYEAAVDYLRLLTSEKWAKLGAQKYCKGDISPIKGIKPAFSLNQGSYSSPSKALESANALQPYYDQFLPPELAEMHKDTCQAVFTKSLEPKEAMEMWEKARKEYFKLK